MRRLLLVTTLLSAMHFLSAQTTRYVYPYATGSGDGTSWTNAYTNLQTAIDASAAGDNLFVAKATYKPASGKSFVMKEGVKIYGGFLGTENSLDLRNMDNRATLPGNGGTVIVNNNNGLTAAAVLDGFIVTGGNATTDNVTAGFGGGMLSYNASPRIVHCNFTKIKFVKQ